MKGIIRTLALGAVVAGITATGAIAQGVNNTGYSRAYYGDNSYYGNNGYNGNGYYGNSGYNGNGTWYDRQGYNGYGYTPGYANGPVEGPANVVGGALNAAGDVAGSAVNAASSVMPPWGNDKTITATVTAPTAITAVITATITAPTVTVPTTTLIRIRTGPAGDPAAGPRMIAGIIRASGAIRAADLPDRRRLGPRSELRDLG